MINEGLREELCHGSRDNNLRNYRNAGIDLSGIVWADSSGYMGNLYLLWVGLVLANSSWNLVARNISEVDA